jgi:hypothetical protein
MLIGRSKQLGNLAEDDVGAGLIQAPTDKE